MIEKHHTELPPLLVLPETALIEPSAVAWQTRPKDPTTSGLEAMEDNLYRAYKRKASQVVANLAEIGLPVPGEQFRLITRRRFNAIEMLDYIAERETISDLRMAIYSINYYAALHLLELVDSGRIAKVEILMSNLRNAAHREKEEVIKHKFAGHPAITLWFCSSHAKLMSCATSAGNYYTVEGSGNHADNSRVEQYVIDNDQGVYNFTGRWMAEIKQHLAGRGELQICGENP
jgi:hypothetical protein